MRSQGRSGGVGGGAHATIRVVACTTAVRDHLQQDVCRSQHRCAPPAPPGRGLCLLCAGNAATTDLLSSRQSIRFVLTATSKLLDWPAIAEARRWPSDRGGSSGGATRNSELAPWTRALRPPRGPSGTAAAGGGGSSAGLAWQKQGASVQDVALLAASVRRRVMFYLQQPAPPAAAVAEDPAPAAAATGGPGSAGEANA